MLFSLHLLLLQVHGADEVTGMLQERLGSARGPGSSAGSQHKPTQTLAGTWVPLAVPATRIFTMAVTSSLCFLSSSSSTWEGPAGQCRLRGSALPTPPLIAFPSPQSRLGRTLNTTT